MSSSTEAPAKPRQNTYLRFLGVGGSALLILGAVIGIASKTNGDREMMVAQFGATLVGGIFDDSSAQALYGWAWTGVVIAALGAIMLLAWVIIRAARN